MRFNRSYATRVISHFHYCIIKEMKLSNDCDQIRRVFGGSDFSEDSFKWSIMMVQMLKMELLMFCLWSVPAVDTEVSCGFMERCILPCSFQVGPQVAIHWTKTAGNVHSYYDNQDQLGHQLQIYRNRTSLFQDQISRGNASLQLTGVKVQDEGIYKCFISTINRNKELFINLKVDAPVHKVNIQQVENRITCSSEGIYPQPELTWSTTPPSNINLHNTTTVQQNEQQLYSISSSLILSDNDTDLVYSCTIKTHRNKRTATLSRTTPISGSTSETIITCAACNAEETLISDTSVETSGENSVKGGMNVGLIVGVSVAVVLLLILLCVMITKKAPLKCIVGFCMEAVLAGLCFCIA